MVVEKTKKTAFLFPGQGAQFVGMGKKLLEDFPLANQVFEEASEALDFDLKKLCLFGPEDELQRTKNTQPAILGLSTAVYRVLQAETDLRPHLVAGHSLGEYSALVAAGALEFPQAVRMVHKRGECMQRAVPEGEGAMAALIGCSHAIAQKICEEAQKTHGVCEVANFNGGGQIVISGHKKAVDVAMILATEEKLRAVPLAVSAPFHCSLMRPAAEELLPILNKLIVHELSLPYIPNVWAHLCDDHHQIVKNLYQQVDQSVLWEQSMEQLPQLGIEQCFEIGPRRTLSGFMRRICKIPCTSLDYVPLS